MPQCEEASLVATSNSDNPTRAIVGAIASGVTNDTTAPIKPAGGKHGEV